MTVMLCHLANPSASFQLHRSSVHYAGKFRGSAISVRLVDLIDGCFSIHLKLTKVSALFTYSSCRCFVCTQSSLLPHVVTAASLTKSGFLEITCRVQHMSLLFTLGDFKITGMGLHDAGHLALHCFKESTFTWWKAKLCNIALGSRSYSFSLRV